MNSTQLTHLSVRESKIDHLPWIAELINKYPFKAFQREFYKIDKDVLNDYNVRRVQQAIEQKPGSYSVFDKENTPVGFFLLQHSPWHSEIFRLQYLKLSDLWTDQRERKLDVLRTACQVAGEKGAELVAFRCDAEDVEFIRAAGQLEARFLGISVKYCAHRNSLDTNARKNYTSQTDYSVRSAQKCDLAWMQRVAQKAHQTSYFFNDSRLPPERSHLLFSEWTRRCVEGLADQVLVLTVEGQPAGMVTLLLPKALSKAVGKQFGVLDFIAVDTRWQGQGLGTKFASEAFRWLAGRADFVEARTMLNNFRAQNLYARLGLRVVAADAHFHWGKGETL